MSSLHLYAHPFSSYSQKVLIALYENVTEFDYRNLEDKEADAELKRISPVGLFPVLVDAGRTVFESTPILQHLQSHHPGPVRIIPEHPDEAVDAHMLDRIFDNYVMTPVQKIVKDHMRPDDARDPYGVAQAHTLLDKAYAWLDARLDGREWACDSGFGLADCAAAPSLLYADWVHPILAAQSNLRAYRARLLARPSVARAVDEARPFRHYFPPGAPDRD